MKKKTALGPSGEDYLKTIYDLCAEDGVVTTTELAAAMRVSAASTTNMIKKLAALKLVRHSPYYGVELTPAGAKIALEIVRHHRLIESFLHEALGIPWDEVHAEAHKLEHVLSDKLEDHIADYLGHPTEDPHGDPIPTKAGAIAATDQQSLAELEPGAHATIRRIMAQDPGRLRYLRGLGLIPKANVSLIDHAPFQGPVRVRVENGNEHSLDHALAQQIWVSAQRKRLSKPRQEVRR